MTAEPLRPEDPLDDVGFDREAKRRAFLARVRGVRLDEKLATLIGPGDARPIKGCPIAVIDTETTGLDAREGYVVEVAVVHHEIGSDADPVVAFKSYVKPPIPIPADSTKITGIDDATVADAPPFRDVIDGVVAACDGRLVVAHNAPFDALFLREEFQRAKRTPLGWPWLDTFVIRKGTKTRGRPGKLSEIAGEYGIMLDAHGASGDALVTALLVTPMLRDLYVAIRDAASRGWQDEDDYGYDDEPPPAPAKVEFDVARLLGWLRDAALEQEREFTSYAMRSGWTSPPSCGWHTMEGREPPPFRPPAPKMSRCSSCGNAIVWAVSKDGKRMPLDYDPVEVVIIGDVNVAPEIVGRHLVPEGQTPTVQLVSGFTWPKVEHTSGYVVPAEMRPDLARSFLHVSHFATCAHAAEHRKPKAVAS